MFLYIRKMSLSVLPNYILKIIYEDEHILLINKPAGLVVHPGCGNLNGTLMDILLHKKKYLSKIPRAGIVHRLDKNTTGLMIIAKNNLTYNKLITLIKDRKITRKYDAFVIGHIISGGTVSAPITRNTKKRTCMMVNISGKPSVTHYQIVQRFNFYTHIHIQLESGRTHQIRVHMLHIKHPILGDPIYKISNYFPRNINIKFLKKINLFSRQALHASHIKFFHPITNILIDCYATLPEDMVAIMKYL
ncbi:Ribosomal large subunit pseudouridine synthase D [Buchnera aphidicola (Takecallis arundicolens)]|uniref:RluA family pseudouridine synthase n=1 Tax=Buchnera aphidicola TaxID=9 RepID=UPI0034645153